MNLSLSVNQTLVIESPGVILRGALPVLNGNPLESWTCEVLRSDQESIELRYASPSLGKGLFGLRANEFNSQIKIRFTSSGKAIRIVCSCVSASTTCPTKRSRVSLYMPA